MSGSFRVDSPLVVRSTRVTLHSVESVLGAQATASLLPSGLKNCCQLRTTPFLNS